MKDAPSFKIIRYIQSRSSVLHYACFLISCHLNTISFLCRAQGTRKSARLIAQSEEGSGNVRQEEAKISDMLEEVFTGSSLGEYFNTLILTRVHIYYM